MASKSAAVLPAKGIGDALLMMIASHHLLKAGFEVTTFHSQLAELSHWFPGHYFDATLPNSYSSYDLVLFENDNSPRVQKLPNGAIFYPTYSPPKHGPLSSLDCVFDANLPMADNIARAIAQILHSPGVSKDNGLQPPAHLLLRRHEKRVVLHPLSSDEEKNWPKKKYLLLAEILKKEGFEPIFVVSPKEREGWEDILSEGFSLPHFPTLDSLAAFIYESGYVIGNDSLLGHLASNMHLSTLIIANCEKRMRLWRPAWRQGVVITPSKLVPNCKPFRLRRKYWQLWISPGKVFSAFNHLTSTI